MEVRDPVRLRIPTDVDVGRLLATINTLHATAVVGRGAVLAERVVGLLDADGAAVDVAGPDGTVRRVARTGGRYPGDRPPGGPASFRVDGGIAVPVVPYDATEVADIAGSDEWAADATVAVFDWPVHRRAGRVAGRASVVRSDYVLGGVASRLTAWRAMPFGGREATLLRLLHPHVAWAIVPAAPGLPPVAGEVLELMLVGLPEKEIARRLNRSRHTIHAHVKRVYRHYAVRSRPELIARHFGRDPGACGDGTTANPETASV